MKKKLTFTERARKGGLARAKKLSKRRRVEIGRQGALIRWARVAAAAESPFPVTA